MRRGPRPYSHVLVRVEKILVMCDHWRIKRWRGAHLPLHFVIIILNYGGKSREVIDGFTARKNIQYNVRSPADLERMGPAPFVIICND